MTIIPLGISLLLGLFVYIYSTFNSPSSTQYSYYLFLLSSLACPGLILGFGIPTFIQNIKAQKNSKAPKKEVAEEDFF